jgi:hypothetical protein
MINARTAGAQPADGANASGVWLSLLGGQVKPPDKQ